MDRISVSRKFKYITVKSLCRTPKTITDRWEIFTRQHHQLGMIKWFPHWGRFCFFVQGCDTENALTLYLPKEYIFSSECLADITSFLTEVNELHKLQLIKIKRETNI